MRNHKKSFIAAIAVLALAAAGPAYGQSSVEGYNPDGTSVAGEVQGGGSGSGSGEGAGANNGAGNPGGNVAASQAGNAAGTTAAADEGGRLPFTGSDLGLLAAAGVFLLAFGLVMRRITRRPNAA